MAGPRRGMWIIRNMFNQAEFDSYPVARELTRIYLTLRGPNVGGAVRRFDLLPVATRQPMTIYGCSTIQMWEGACPR